MISSSNLEQKIQQMRIELAGESLRESIDKVSKVSASIVANS